MEVTQIGIKKSVMIRQSFGRKNQLNLTTLLEDDDPYCHHVLRADCVVISKWTTSSLSESVKRVVMLFEE